MNLIKNMSERANTNVRNLCGETKDFSDRVGLNQDLALSLYFPWY